MRLRERQPSHQAASDLRAFDSVRHAVASLFGGEGESETSSYLQRMHAIANPHGTPAGDSSPDNFAAVEKTLLLCGVTRSPASS